MIHIRRQAHTLRLLHLQPICQTNHGHDATDIVNMQVLVKGLRSTETERITGPQVYIPHRIIPKIHTRAENDTFHQTVLVNPSSKKETPPGILPLVLGIKASNSHNLLSNTTIAPHIVIEVVFIVLRPDSQVRGHEQALVELVDILCTGHPGQILRAAISIRILTGAIVTFSGYVLGRCKCT